MLEPQGREIGMKKQSLAMAAVLALLSTGCGRGSADKGRANEQQRSDLDDIAAKVENSQSVEFVPDDSLTLNESDAEAALNNAAPANTAAPGAPLPPTAGNAAPR